MAKEYTVGKAFRATISKEDKTPKTVTFNGHTFDVWKVQLNGEESKGWLNLNKKQGNSVNVGDVLYGNLEKITGSFGEFYTFKSESKPMGFTPQTPVSQSGGYVNDKLDKILETLEALVDALSDDSLLISRNTAPKEEKVELADLDI